MPDGRWPMTDPDRHRSSSIVHHPRSDRSSRPSVAEGDEPAVGLGDPVAERGPGDRAEPGVEAGVVEVEGDRELAVAVGDEPGGLGGDLARGSPRTTRSARPRPGR